MQIPLGPLLLSLSALMGTEDYYRPDAKVQEAWLSGREAMQLGDLTQVQAGLQKLYEWKLDAGIPNLFTLSHALERAARRAERERDQGRTQLYLDYAERLSPHLIDLPLTRAHLHLKHQPVDVITAGTIVFNGFRSASGSSIFLSRCILFVLLFLLSTLAVLVILLTLVAARKPVEYLAHLIGHGIRTPVPSTPLRLLIWSAGLLLIPMGIGYALAAALLLAGLMGRSRDRALAAAVALILAASPWVLERAFTIASGLGSEQFLQVASWRDGTGHDAFTRSAEAAFDQGTPLPPQIAIPLASDLKRRGEFEKAATVLEPLKSHPDLAATVLNNLAGSKTALGHHKEAVADYRQAIALRPDSALYHYNLSQVLQRRLLLLNEGEQEIAVAGEIDRRAVQDYIARAGESPNRFVIDELVPMRAMIEWAWLKGSESRLASFDAFWGALTPRLPPFFGTVMFGAICLVGALCSILLGTRLQSADCSRCGLVFCGLCPHGAADKPLCPECDAIYLKGMQLENKDRASKDREVRLFGPRRKWLRLIASIVLPGSGHLIYGLTFRGVVGILLWSALVSLWIAPDDLFTPVLQSWTHTSVWCLTGLGALIWALYVYGTIKAGRKAYG